jgi:hypothetical protein
MHLRAMFKDGRNVSLLSYIIQILSFNIGIETTASTCEMQGT